MRTYSGRRHTKSIIKFIETFQRKMPTASLKTETTFFQETLKYEYTYRTVWCDKPEHHNLNTSRGHDRQSSTVIRQYSKSNGMSRVILQAISLTPFSYGIIVLKIIIRRNAILITGLFRRIILK